MATGEMVYPPGAEAPLDVVTGMLDDRLFETELSGALNNSYVFWQHAQTQGFDVAALLDENTDFMERIGAMFGSRLDQDEAFRDLHNAWVKDLNRTGFQRLFGHEAYQDKAYEFVEAGQDTRHAPQLMYVGELPPALATDQVRDAFQASLNLRYGNHGVFTGPNHVGVLFPGISLSVRPYARTLVQGTREIWHLQTATYIRSEAV